MTSAYLNRGTAYAELGQKERAIEEYSRAIELDPKKTKAYLNRGVAYAELGQMERAIEEYSRAIELIRKRRRLTSTGASPTGSWGRRSGRSRSTAGRSSWIRK